MEAIGRRSSQVFLRSLSGDFFANEDLRVRSSTDFSDVFGGPPKRYSHTQNQTPSVISSYDDDSELGVRSEKEETVETLQRCLSSSSSTIEKPVFGGLPSPARRRHLAGDFYSDIFKGSESPNSTPRRKAERDRLSVNSNSCTFSPGVSLPPPANEFGGESPAANLSYFSRLAKSFDGSPASSPAHTLQKIKENKSNTFILHPINSPSRVTSENDTLENNSSIETKPTTMDIKIESIEMEQSLPTDTSGHYTLHFSMYKWASKGVTLVVPTNCKEKSKGRIRFGAVHAEVSQDMDLPSDKENLPKGVQASQNTVKPEDNHSNPLPGNVKAASPAIIAGVLRDITKKSDELGIFGEGTEVKNLHHTIADDLEREEKVVFPRRTTEKNTTTGDIKKGTRITKNPEKPKQAVVKEKMDTGSHEKTKLAAQGVTKSSSRIKESLKIFESRESTPKESRETRTEERHTSKRVNKYEDRAKHHTSSIAIAPVALKLKDEQKNSRRVNEDENRVNYHSSTIPVTPVALNSKEERQNSQRVKKDEDGVNYRASAIPVTPKVAQFLKEELQSTRRVNKDEETIKYPTSTVPDTPNFKEGRQSSKRANKDEDRVNYQAYAVPIAPNLKEEHTQDDSPNIRKVDGSFSDTGNISRTFSDSTVGDFEATFCGIEIKTVDDIDDIVVFDISQDYDEAAEIKLREEEMLKSDAKIREWSRGREGNIRSLLSTLQNVLWPGSGWKPVKLVDLLEGPAVKRSYQKALLYLHPDKLQQKGAEAHQKYIAEKVFDILQDAWNHFNTLGQV